MFIFFLKVDEEHDKIRVDIEKLFIILWKMAW